MAALVPLPELWLMRDRFLEMRSCCSAALCPSSVHQSCPLPIGPAIGQLLVPQGTSIMIGIVCGSSPAPEALTRWDNFWHDFSVFIKRLSWEFVVETKMNNRGACCTRSGCHVNMIILKLLRNSELSAPLQFHELHSASHRCEPWCGLHCMQLLCD